MKNPIEILDAAIAQLEQMVVENNAEITAKVQQRQNFDALIVSLQDANREAERHLNRLRNRT